MLPARIISTYQTKPDWAIEAAQNPAYHVQLNRQPDIGARHQRQVQSRLRMYRTRLIPSFPTTSVRRRQLLDRRASEHLSTSAKLTPPVLLPPCFRQMLRALTVLGRKARSTAKNWWILTTTIRDRAAHHVMGSLSDHTTVQTAMHRRRNSKRVWPIFAICASIVRAHLHRGKWCQFSLSAFIWLLGRAVCIAMTSMA